MAGSNKIWFLVLGFIIGVANLGNIKAEVPTIFIFGDSTADVGTNNYLQNCTATANNPYYGIDYPLSKPTGRFSNGFNTIDFVVRQLGDYEESPPPFLYLVQNMSSFNSSILHGVNFASGGSGILTETGNRTFNNVVPLGQQIQQFATVEGNLTELLGEAKTEDLLAKSLYIISVGSNDLLEYVLFEDFKNSSTVEFLSNLTFAYQNHLQELYKLGARKFGIVSIPPIGCVPAMRFHSGGTCVEQLNELAQLFYTSTLNLLVHFNSSFGGVKFSLVNAFQLTTHIIGSPISDGFKNKKEACCGIGAFNGKDKCRTNSTLCHERKDFVFWDWFHPTEAVSFSAAGELVYGEEGEFIYPINFSQLASI